MDTKQYYKSIDYVKGIAIFLVILGHCIQCGSGSVYNQNQSFFDDFIFRLIYSFHMPLFMIISGFLFGKTASGKTFLVILKNRSIRLLLPIVVWQTLFMLLSFVRNGGFDAGEYVHSIVEGFWYLWAVWWANVICALIETLGKSRSVRGVLHIIVIVLSLFTPDELNFSLYKFMYVAFLLGYVAAKKNWEQIQISGDKKRVFLASILILYIGLFLLFRRESYIYISGWTLLGKENWLAILGWDAYRTLIGGLGGVIAIYLIYSYAPCGRSRLIKDIGKNSGGIYIIQTYANVIMMRYLAGVGHHIWLNFIEALVICTICYVGVKIISCIPYASLVLFGQKTRVMRKSNE